MQSQGRSRKHGTATRNVIQPKETAHSEDDPRKKSTAQPRFLRPCRGFHFYRRKEKDDLQMYICKSISVDIYLSYVSIVYSLIFLIIHFCAFCALPEKRLIRGATD